MYMKMNEERVLKRINPLYEKHLIEGKFSTYQMHNFYEKFYDGNATLNDAMNYMQHLLITEKCKKNMKVLDVCCGRALMLPMFIVKDEKIKEYVGLDISKKNIHEAENLIKENGHKIEFDYQLVVKDITHYEETYRDYFDSVIYTSAIEHMSRDDGIQSLKNVSSYLRRGGILFLSTPNTLPSDSNQYRCHINEWYYKELVEEVRKMNMEVEELIGLLPPDIQTLERQIRKKFGDSGYRWFSMIRCHSPAIFYLPIMALEFPESSREIMLICRKK